MTSTPKCSIEDCSSQLIARGFCIKHYKRWKRYGDPLFVKIIRDDDIARFWQKVDVKGNEECWEWLGAKGGIGYGRIRWKGRQTNASRVAFEIANGSAPSGFALHSCDNPSCCNPSHIRDGSQADNVNDCIKRNRRVVFRGSNHGMAKLTEDDVRHIRQRSLNGESYRLLADEFCVDKSNISSIVTKKTWKHV